MTHRGDDLYVIYAYNQNKYIINCKTGEKVDISFLDTQHQLWIKLRASPDGKLLFLYTYEQFFVEFFFNISNLNDIKQIYVDFGSKEHKYMDNSCLEPNKAFLGCTWIDNNTFKWGVVNIIDDFYEKYLHSDDLSDDEAENMKYWESTSLLCLEDYRYNSEINTMVLMNIDKYNHGDVPYYPPRKNYINN